MLFAMFCMFGKWESKYQRACAILAGLANIGFMPDLPMLT
jgi:hypothetical protein